MTLSPGFQSYFLAVPRSIATWSAVFGAPPSTYSRTSKVFSVEVETISVGGPLEVIALPLRVHERAVGGHAALGLLDARDRLDLLERVGGHRRRLREVGLDRLARLDGDVDALLGALEEVLERGVDRVGEHERADDERDADDDREPRQDRPQLARQQALQSQLRH